MSGSAAAAGGALGAVGAIQQGQASKAMADTQSQIAANNAQLVEQQGAINAQRIKIQGEKAAGGIRAASGASGISGSSGSALDVLQSSITNAHNDALQVKHSADIQAKNYTAQAGMYEQMGDNAVTGSYFNAAGSLLLGGSKAYEMAG